MTKNIDICSYVSTSSPFNLSKGESIQSSKHHLTYHGDIYQVISFRLCKSSEHKYQAIMHSKTQRFSVNSAKY